jgi:hypothetical protein
VAQAKAGLGAPAVELAVKDGAPVTLRFGGQAGAATELFARGSDDLVFVVPAAQKTWLEGGVEVFRKPPPQPQFNGVQGLEQLPPDIRAKLEAQLGQQQVR